MSDNKKDKIKTNDKVIKPKHAGGRLSKKVKYEKERKDILNKLNKILGINETTNMFYLYDIEHNDKMMKDILDLKPDIEKCFTSKNSAVFKKDNPTKPHTSLIRIVYKEMGYSVVTTNKTINRDNKSIKSTCYLIVTKDQLHPPQEK